MNWTMTKPCDNCPFRRGTAMKLLSGRIREITRMMLDCQGGTFPCHKTTRFDDDSERIEHAGEIHCAGALIFAMKNSNHTQMMRIAGRLGMFDSDKLMEHKNLVFDDTQEMLKHSK